MPRAHPPQTSTPSSTLPGPGHVQEEDSTPGDPVSESEGPCAPLGGRWESWPSSEELRVHPGSRHAVNHIDSRGAFRRQRPRSAPSCSQLGTVSSDTKKDRGKQ